MTAKGDTGTQDATLRRALLALRDIRSKYDTLQRARAEPIAVVGMACRLPGGIEDAESCWNFLRDAKDGTTDVPASRWDVDAHYDPDPEVPGRMHTRRGGFLNEDIDQFDASLFSITPREAKTLDPQQRYLLEVSWEALEDAGYAPDSLAGSSTGVFVGISTNDYMGLMHDGMDYRDIDPYCCTGTAGCAAAGRIAYSMGLEGPCLALDTACSSSLVSLHLAMESLRNGECDMALSAGVNMILSPVLNIYFSKLKALAKDGRCKTFDASADGYGRGEGCGVIVLKRLSDAQADGDRILGQLLGSAVNHDGRSGGLTVPSVSAQESVIRSALGKAGLSPADIGYIEAHGTGTPLGDPIEIRALTRIFGPDRPADVPLWVGSVKTNIGHLEAAAGIAGVIKTLLSLQEKTLPAHLHFSQMNPHISHEGLDLRLPQKTQDWPSTVPQVAGVSSFGISGTNAHIVVAGAPDDNVNAASPQAVIERDEHVLTLSARSAASLEEVARRYERDLTVLPPEEFADYCYTSNIGRADFAHRLAISASTPETAITEIKKKAAETADEHVDDGQREKLAMVMARPSQALLTQGRKLYLSEPIFKQAFDACQKAIPADRNVDLPARLLAADPVADEARHKQLELTCCAISIAAARMWIAWGVSPFTLGGEGLSEIAAAHVSGLLGLSDTLELAMHCAALAQASDARDSALEATAKIALRSFAEGLKPRSARFGFASGNTLPKPEFWAQCAMPAHRGRGLDALAAQGCTIALVLGDDGTATALPPQTKPLFGLPSFEKGKGHSVSATAAQLWLKGFAFDWAKYHRGFTRKRVKIAPSPFERRRYWLDKVNQDRRVTQTSDTADTQPRLYQMNWETCPAPTVSQDASETTVLILSESGIGGEELAKHLEGRAARVQSRAFNLPQNDASQTWSELVLLFDETEQGLGDDAQNLCRAQAGLSAKLSAFAQAVEDSGQTPPPRLTIVTKGAYAFQSAPHNWNAVQSALLGLCRVLRNEYPTLRPRLIDCDPSKDFDWLALASEVLIRSEIEDEPESILRAEQRFVARLAPANNATISQQSMAQSLTAEGSYLITGGTGGLGRTVTDWLVQNGARNIILVSRTGETAQLKSHMEGWATQGANVQIARCDIAVQSEVDALLSDIRSGPHGLRGIVHAAGVLDDGLIADMTAERFEAVLAPKVAGLLTLAEASKSDDLDWLVSFSSIAGVLGSPGQANYAAANVVLDSYSALLRDAGRKAVSIAWGPWDQIGMTGRDTVRAKAGSKHGLTPLSQKDALQLLDQSLRIDTAELVAATADWHALAQASALAQTPAVLSNLITHRDTPEDKETANAIAQHIKDAPSADHKTLMLDHLKERLADILEVPASEISETEDVIALGMDSLMVMELVHVLKQDLSIPLYPREVMERPKIQDFANYLTAELIGSDQAKAPNQPKNAKSFAAVSNIVDSGPPLKPAHFLLSAPRSGSTLLRVMLAGHPQLFAPPELHLLPFADMGTRQTNLGASYLGEGLQRAYMELTGLNADESAAKVAQLCTDKASTRDVYSELQTLAGDRILLDKSPSYGADLATLQRTDTLFEDAKCIHLTRHPIAAIDSFARMRMDKLIGAEGGDVHQIAERVWSQINGNITEFVAQRDSEKCLHVSYEALVNDPKIEMTRICDFLNIPYDQALLHPYEGQRMTDGVSKKSASIGDPGFSKRKAIETGLAESWRNVELPKPLSHQTTQIAQALGYELSQATPIERRERQISIGSTKLHVTHWGPETGKPLLLLHGLLDQGAAWRDVAQPLAEQGFHVIAPDQRGHGQSAHAPEGTAYHIMDFVSDAAAILEQIDGDVTLVGHSMGAVVALLLAAGRADRIETLTLIEPPLNEQKSSATSIGTYLDYVAEPPKNKPLRDLDAAISRLQFDTPSLGRDFARNLAERATHVTEDGLHWRWDPRLKTRAGIAFGQDIPGNATLSEIIAQIAAPVLTVYGDVSKMSDPAAAQRLAQTCFNLQSITLSGGHNLHFDAPVQLSEAISRLTRSKPSDRVA